jgi:hypothetical protein
MAASQVILSIQKPRSKKIVSIWGHFFYQLLKNFFQKKAGNFIDLANKVGTSGAKWFKVVRSGEKVGETTCLWVNINTL